LGALSASFRISELTTRRPGPPSASPRRNGGWKEGQGEGRGRGGKRGRECEREGRWEGQSVSYRWHTLLMEKGPFSSSFRCQKRKRIKCRSGFRFVVAIISFGFRNCAARRAAQKGEEAREKGRRRESGWSGVVEKCASTLRD